MQTLLETIRSVVGGNAQFVWIPERILAAHSVRAYSEMPFWLPTRLGARPIPVERARAKDRELALRPFADTVRDTWVWLAAGWDAEVSVRENRQLHVPGGMAPEREAQILEAARLAR
jgi:hypothetical protein